MVEVAVSCPACDYEIKDNDFVFCPMCGGKLEDGEPSLVTSERLQYLWERWEKGRFLDSNFLAFKNIGRFPYIPVKVIRDKLGDFAHMNILNLQIYSFLYCNPKHSVEFYRIGKLLGFHSGATALKAGKVDNLVNLINKTGLSWKVFENEKVRDVYVGGWNRVKGGKSRWVNISKDKGLVRIVMDESPSSAFHSTKPACMWLAGVQCGHMGVLFDGIWEGVETKCVSAGDPRCEFELKLCKEEETIDVPQLSKKELDEIVESLTRDVVERDKTYRKELGDFYHFGVNQYMNYFLMALSEGHAILSKHSGVVCGERIVEKAGISGQDETFSYACDLFEYLKAGILQDPRTEGDKILLLMEESVYSSGVSNIHMKLNVFLAGII